MERKAMNRFRLTLALAGLGVLGFWPWAMAAAQSAPSGPEQEAATKAAFICKFIDHVDYPQSPDSSDSGAFLIVVIGNPAYLHLLKEQAVKKTCQGRPIVVRHVSAVESLTSAQVVVIGTDSGAVLESILQRLKGLPILTVSDAEGFAERGTMINFVIVDGERGRRVRFEINRQATARAGLRIGAPLLKLAILVEEGGTR